MRLLLYPQLATVLMIDGIVSVLRTHTVEELKAMVSKLEGSDTYEWKVGASPISSYLPRLWVAPYIIGIPKVKTN